MFIDIKHGHAEGEDFDVDSNTPFKFLVKEVGPDGQLPVGDSVVEALDALGDAMVAEPDSGDSTLPPIYTYWAQFLDHELTARTDRTTEVSDITLSAADLEPVPRDRVERNLFNRRTPAIELDAVYGDGLPGQHGIRTRMSKGRSFGLARALRDGAKLRVGSAVVVNRAAGESLGALPPPLNDLARDLPRIGALLDLGVVKEEDFPKDLRALGTFRKRAFIGDPRNDENLIVAQFHVAMLRFHNAVVDWLSHKERRIDPPGRNDLFEDAQRIVRWTFQWLVVNDFMKNLLQEDVVDAVIKNRARAYFRRAGDGHEPFMPIEFSVACYRFGHSMIRAAYDYNRNFGIKEETRREDGFILPSATLEALFAFTGKSANPFPQPPAPPASLPHNWIIEWRRFDGTDPQPRRFARKIDTHLALPLGSLANEADPDPVKNTLLKQLARRNLRRGYQLSLPTGQALATALDIRPLTAAQVSEGNTQAVNDALIKGGFVDRTPLWFYTLKEAELLGGNKLGPLGSRIVAETLVGVLLADPESYLVKNPRWNPSKPILGTGGPLRVQGRAIEKIGDLLEFAGVKPPEGSG